MTTVRLIRPDEYELVGELTAVGYGGYVGEDYINVLRDVASRAGAADVLVAELDGRVVGSVAFVHKGGPYEDIGFGPDEAEFRMLVVADEARRRGVGEELVRECIALAVSQGRRVIVISTQPTMTAAHRMYERLGFRRVPERDWEPRPGVPLLAYEMDLAPWRRCGHCGELQGPGEAHAECLAALALEPPRFCELCGRRMVVQVLPAGWLARCSEHGELASS